MILAKNLDVLSRTVFSYYMASRAELTADTQLLPVSFRGRVIHPQGRVGLAAGACWPGQDFLRTGASPNV